MKKIFVTKAEFEGFVSLRNQETGVKRLIEIICIERKALWDSIITKYGLDPKQRWDIDSKTRKITQIGECEKQHQPGHNS